ncbi:hypothetical protein PHYBOEH_004248 [Phytophthora boehmeriae]|uniref:Uncharacterized protein n=1 Tax=Phytophthora boehmeriae TaxID=109152 RepID=A0A8T1WNW5_9STRA|nr:hypothetical protein PHYBOEH_004248 [Phytophthora boehmeriae]
MDSSFIPPPFPFVEAWPRIFAEKQQQWLTPSTFTALHYEGPVVTNAQYHQHEAVEISTDQDEDEDEEDGGEFEYGYVLSDEWRTRFQSSRRQLQPSQQKHHSSNSNKRQQRKKNINSNRPKQTVNKSIAASRSEHLQREVQAAKRRELANKWKRRDPGSNAACQRVEAMETSLNALFDEFCDAFQPVVWPHDPLH